MKQYTIINPLNGNDLVVYISPKRSGKVFGYIGVVPEYPGLYTKQVHRTIHNVLATIKKMLLNWDEIIKETDIDVPIIVPDKESIRI